MFATVDDDKLKEVLYVAVLNGEEAVKKLLDQGVKPYPIAMRAAIDENKAPVVKILLDAKANPNDRGVLSDACSHGFASIVKLLLEAGATEDRKMSLYLAEQACHDDVVVLLGGTSKSSEVKYVKQGILPLHAAEAIQYDGVHSYRCSFLGNWMCPCSTGYKLGPGGFCTSTCKRTHSPECTSTGCHPKLSGQATMWSPEGKVRTRQKTVSNAAKYGYKLCGETDHIGYLCEIRNCKGGHCIAILDTKHQCWEQNCGKHKK